MKEEKLIQRQLLKNMLYSFIAFGIIFTIFGVIIFNNLKTELYKAVDSELERAVNRYQEERENRSIESRQGADELPIVNGITVKQPININPRIIEIIRDEKGNIVNQESIGRFYDEYHSAISFQKNKLNTIYDIQVEQYFYRAINLRIISVGGESRYIQLLINVDAEKNVIDNYLNILTLGIITTILLSIIASYILSKRALRPIIDSWEKQTEFVQNASHELRTPLTIIQTKQELLLQEPESKIIDKSEDIRLTLNEAKRLGKLTKDLMLLARADSNRVVLNKEETDIDKFIKEIAIPYQDFASIQEKEINLNLNYKKTINIDKNQIHQLMVILLDNAMKYTEEGNLIQIDTYSKDNKCVIEVRDSGIGISEETIKHAFDRFYREDKARSREKGGSGLGLSIANFIVSMHGGSIKLSHNEPKGTVVTVKLPR